jgi:hypothetical protein
MKTKIIIITCIAAVQFICQPIEAQFKYGLHASANLETQAELGQLWNNVDLYQGYLAGGFLEYQIGNKLSLQTELNYQKKGAKLTSDLQGSVTTVRRDFNYLTVPLLIKGTMHDSHLGDNWDLTLFTGPYLGFLTSAHSNTKTGNSSTSVDLANSAEKTDWGVIFGGGVIYKLGNGGALVAELRYQMGLNTIDKEDKDLRNKGMGITVGYRF